MTSADPAGPEAEPGSGGFSERSLATIERVGNKVPHPAIMFLALCIAVIGMSQLLAWAGVGGVRFMFTSFVPNYMGFTAMGIILIVMIGVGVAERSGLIATLIHRLVASSSPAALTYIIVFLGVVSSVASDAGYLVLIPLGAAAFMAVGRHPLAGMAAAFAGVAGGFRVNLMVTPVDAVITEITNESIALVDPTKSIDLTANLWFGIGSTIMLTVLLGW
ncbi:MAG: AbgT family transporter [Candidatus Nanopelagicales bacterium]